MYKIKICDKYACPYYYILRLPCATVTSPLRLPSCRLKGCMSRRAVGATALLGENIRLRNIH